MTKTDEFVGMKSIYLARTRLEVLGIQMNKYNKIKELKRIIRCLDNLSYEWSVITSILTQIWGHK